MLIVHTKNRWAVEGFKGWMWKRIDSWKDARRSEMISIAKTHDSDYDWVVVILNVRLRLLMRTSSNKTLSGTNRFSCIRCALFLVSTSRPVCWSQVVQWLRWEVELIDKPRLSDRHVKHRPRCPLGAIWFSTMCHSIVKNNAIPSSLQSEHRLRAETESKEREVAQGIPYQWTEQQRQEVSAQREWARAANE